MPQSIGTPVLWGGFVVFIFLMMAVEIAAIRRNPHEMSMREASTWTVSWITLALLFGAGIAWHFGRRPAVEYFTGYVIEYALSVDNLFVFILIFKTFGVPPTYQRRVLIWGILGAMILRAVFILAGAALISRFDWLLYVFGAFLIYTGGKILVGHDVETHPENNPVLKLFGKVFPIVRHFGDGKFIVKHHGRWYATALMPVLLVVEATDVLFAVDSIPAIFAVTRDPFIVFTSNVFAILGLRALYFVLKTMMDAFRFLKVGLGLVLVFVGAKMCAEKWVHVPAEISLLVVVALLGAAVAASLLWPEKPGGNGEAGESDVKAAGGDGTEEIGDGKMNPR
ncbi:TerC family protein [Candidatus Deferrimicrobium sp.]|uniref:TerC family protein n=1 Tax=Candidatus Deferrimicrobium sp. TaxID=3060586 RepID=UPI00271C595A|nr:TerC family protein [Candidatus Deferrimicrobium sp.]MDO8738213.1 TerC family protein [Candidatus Deferrimicrobium sp.]